MVATKPNPAWALVSSLLVLLAPGPLDGGRLAAAEEPKDQPIEDVTFIAACDGTEQKYVLLYPPGFDSTRSCSLLIALHGHGSDRWQFIQQPRDECRAVREVAAAHGLLLVSPDYRATTSWMGPKAESDLLQIIQSLEERLSVDRVILCGGSMGGTGALTFTALHTDLIDGVVALNGTANLVEYQGFPEAIAESFGGARSDIPDEYRKRSAEFFPEKFQVPIACTTGGQDTIVPPDSVLRLLKEVSRHNPHVLRLHRPEGGHSSNHEDTQAALEFVIAHMKPRAISDPACQNNFPPRMLALLRGASMASMWVGGSVRCLTISCCSPLVADTAV